MHNRRHSCKIVITCVTSEVVEISIWNKCHCFSSCTLSPRLTLYFRMTCFDGMKQLVRNSGWRVFTSWTKARIEGCISRTTSLSLQRPFRATRSSDWAFDRQVILSSSCSRRLLLRAKFCTQLEDVRWELHKRIANVGDYTSNEKKLQSRIGLLSSLQGWLHRLREPASPERKSWPSWMKMKRTRGMEDPFFAGSDEELDVEDNDSDTEENAEDEKR